MTRSCNSIFVFVLISTAAAWMFFDSVAASEVSVETGNTSATGVEVMTEECGDKITVTAQESLPWVVAVTDFVTIDSIAIDGLKFENKPVEVPELATLTAEDRSAAHPVMLGFVLLAEANDAAKTNSANRRAQMEDNDFARAKELADYEKKIRSGIRNVVIGADILVAELASYPEIFNVADKNSFEKASLLLAKKDELQLDYLANLARSTGVTHIIQGTVSDLRTSTKTFNGYGISTRTVLYEVDVMLKVLDLRAGRIIYAKSYTGKVKISNNNDVVQVNNSDNFVLALKDALRTAGRDLAVVAENSDKKENLQR